MEPMSPEDFARMMRSYFFLAILLIPFGTLLAGFFGLLIWANYAAAAEERAAQAGAAQPLQEQPSADSGANGPRDQEPSHE